MGLSKRGELAKIFNMFLRGVSIPRMVLELYKDDRRYADALKTVIRGCRRLDFAMPDLEALAHQLTTSDRLKEVFREFLEIELIRDEIRVLERVMRRRALILSLILTFTIPIISSLLPTFHLIEYISSLTFLGNSVSIGSTWISAIYFFHGLASLLISLYYMLRIFRIRFTVFWIIAIILYTMLFFAVGYMMSTITSLP